MGIVKKILAIRDVPPVSTLYSDYASIDLSENFHLHWRNSRFAMDDEEFRDFCDLVQTAYRRWKGMGSPIIHEEASKGDQYILATSKIKEHPGSGNPFIANEGIRVELIQWADFIHIHWKWARLEFDYDEFLEFADSMTQAAEDLRSAPWFTTAPRRIGTHHVACPRGRVDKQEDTEFWTQQDQDAWLDDRHRTIFLRSEDATNSKLPNSSVKADESAKSGGRIYVRDNDILSNIKRLAKGLKRRAVRAIRGN